MIATIFAIFGIYIFLSFLNFVWNEINFHSAYKNDPKKEKAAEEERERWKNMTPEQRDTYITVLKDWQ